MLDGWYCRSAGNYSGNSEDSSSHEEDLSDFKERYHNLKRKFKLLIYENECFQEALRSTQRQLLKTNRDKSFLMDRLLHYERVGGSVSESDDDTDSSEDESLNYDNAKRKKIDFNAVNQSCLHLSTSTKSHYGNKKKKSILKSIKMSNSMEINNVIHYSLISDGHMTPEEVERHLESRQNYLELVPEKAPPTVPTEMFSNDGSLDKLE